MKSTPIQTEKRRELKRLVTILGELAWKRSPEVAQSAIVAGKNTPLVPGVVDYDEFFVIQHSSKALPATKTGGKVFLRFRRRVTRDRKNEALWHLWEPEYAATKPESVEELLPVIQAQIALLSDSPKNA